MAVDLVVEEEEVGNYIIESMLNLDKVIRILEGKRDELEKKLKSRRLDMADQDNSNVSRYITATRWLVEQEIEDLDKEVIRLELGIRESKKFSGETKRFYKEYFVSKSFEYLELGVISEGTQLGEDAMNHLKR